MMSDRLYRVVPYRLKSTAETPSLEEDFYVLVEVLGVKRKVEGQVL